MRTTRWAVVRSVRESGECDEFEDSKFLPAKDAKSAKNTNYSIFDWRFLIRGIGH